MATQLENEKAYTINAESFQESLFPHYRKLLKVFRKIAKGYVLFHILYAFLFLSEIVSIVFLLAARTEGTFLALSLGALFLTTFSYSLFHFYFQSKRPKQFQALKEEFLTSARQALGIPKGELEHHLSISHAALSVASYLEDFEKHLYRAPDKMKNLKPYLDKWSIFCHFKDVYLFKKLFLQAAIEEHLEQIRITPSDFEVHTSLANVYTSLSKISQEPAKLKDHPFLRLKFRELVQQSEAEAKEHFLLAVEEFKILEYYAPNDPWVHLQLAKSYQELSLPQEEIKEYETLLTLRPLDKDALFRLGVLYFQQGKTAKGLEIYEDLKTANFKKAEELLAHYGAMKK